MNNIRIKTFIHTIFIIAIASISVSFWLFWKFETGRFVLEQYEGYHEIAESFFKQHDEAFVATFALDPLEDQDKKLTILKEAKEIYAQITESGRFRVFAYKGQNYIYLQQFGDNLMYQLPKTGHYFLKIIAAVYILIMIMILFIYGAFLQKLDPLLSLRSSMERFRGGDMHIKAEKFGDDEIGDITDKFNESVHEIQKLIESKNLFMRNILHELKTPITKGLIALETLEESYEKKFIQKSYYRMNELITDLANVEKISSGFLEVRKEQVTFARIIDEVERTLMHKDRVEYRCDEVSLYVDSKLFALALKNLIDNGMKFGAEVVVEADSEAVRVISKGEILEKPLEYYTEPFAQDKKRDSGFGLGLYIVNMIVQAHGHQLEYTHQEGKNIFSVTIQHPFQSTEKAASRAGHLGPSGPK
jgi:two-component system OmpR family sensor kinase